MVASTSAWCQSSAHRPSCRLCRCILTPKTRLCGFSQISINYEMMVFTKLLISTAMVVNFEACLFWFIGIVQAPHGWMHEFGVMATTGSVCATSIRTAFVTRMFGLK